MKKECVMLIGVPGVGKTTYANELKTKEKNKDCKIFSNKDVENEFYNMTDDQVFAKVHEQIENFLNSTKTKEKDRLAIYDATNIKKERRKTFCSRMNEQDIEVNAVFFNDTLENCLKKNAMRDEQALPHNLEMDYYDLEVPYYNEGFKSIEVINMEEVESCE
jgi:predicted kinase